jgi:DNA helicase-2/ATP-dependent DNA helicase PcrA
LAGPGSGKTFVIEHRYKFLVESGVDPDKIIVCTFGKQSATDMGQRILKTCPEANLEQICTINALCYRLLAKWYSDSRWYNWRGPKDWQIKKTLEDIVGPLWQEKEKPNVQEVHKCINTSKYLGLTTDDSYQHFVNALGQKYGDWLYEIRSKFDAWLNRNRFITFADQLFLVEQQLKNDSNWRSMLQEQFSHVIVDEGQDTNYQAMRILITISLEPGQNTVYESEER